MSTPEISFPPTLAGRHEDVQQIVTLLEESAGALVITSPPNRGLSDLLDLLRAHLMQGSRPIITADARLAADAGDLARVLATEAVGALQPDALDWWQRGVAPATRETISAYRALAAAGGGHADIENLRQGGGEGPRKLEQAFALIAGVAPPEGAVVAIDHADVMLRRRFDRARPDDLSGALRSAIQQFPDLQLVLFGHQDGPLQRAVQSPTNPLFYAAQLVVLPALSPTELSKALRGQPLLEGLGAATIGVACEVCAAVPAVTLAVLRRVVLLAGETGEDHPGLVLDAYIELVAESHARLAMSVDFSRELHRLGPRILQSLAAGATPYQLPESSKIIYEALGRLQETGLIWQPAPRSWALSDPLLCSWLRDEV